MTWYPADPTGPNPPLPFQGFVNVTQDTVEYPPGVFRQKNVLDLIAMNQDNPQPDICGNCKVNEPCPSCHKRVRAAGAVQTAELYASGRYDVLAKVPAASGLVWAVWYVAQPLRHVDAHCIHNVRSPRPGPCSPAGRTTTKTTWRGPRAQTTRATSTGTAAWSRTCRRLRR